MAIVQQRPKGKGAPQTNDEILHDLEAPEVQNTAKKIADALRRDQKAQRSAATLQMKRVRTCGC